MKKLLLFIASCLTLATQAQERMVTMLQQPSPDARSYSSLRAIKASRDAGTARKTTATNPRWYSYADYFDANETLSIGEPALFSQYLWNDTMAVMAYGSLATPEWNHNRMVSMGIVTDPAFDGFNDVSFFSGQMKVTPTDAYSVDSIRFYGNYGFNPAKTGFTDTLRVTFAYALGTTFTDDVYRAKTGNPLVLTRYGLSAGDSMNTYRLHYDSVTTTPKGVNIVTKDILLDNSGPTPAWGDTLSNGMYEAKLQVAAGGIPIGANFLLGAAVTFISGDPAFTPHDTVFMGNAGYKYNMFRPYTLSRWTGTSYAFPSYSPTDRNNGIFKSEPDTANGWGGQYIPQWFWSSTGGTASSLQYPLMEFHVICPTCGQVGDGVVDMVVDVNNTIKANAYPNPTSNELTIPFLLSNSADVTVALSNTLGQQVAAMQFTNAAQGKAVFNTTNLPAGIYIYTVTTNSSKESGRVTIVR